MMKVDIFDVGHGGCSVITCPNDTRLMVDCGFRLNPPWFPSVRFAGERVDSLIISNLDEDHVKDLPHVWQSVVLGSIFTNPTVPAPALATMKREHGMGSGVRQVHAILQRFGPGLIGTWPNLGSVQTQIYWNRLGWEFSDTNDLSLAVFVRYSNFTILFAGDLEKAAWRALLRVPGFILDLASVNVFVASHHGRESGFCEEILQFCQPNVFVISDKEKKYESQETTDWYRQRALGISDLTRLPHPLFGYPRRYVLTTRSDGSLSIWVARNGQFLITPQRPYPLSWLDRQPLNPKKAGTF